MFVERVVDHLRAHYHRNPRLEGWTVFHPLSGVYRDHKQRTLSTLDSRQWRETYFTLYNLSKQILRTRHDNKVQLLKRYLQNFVFRIAKQLSTEIR